MNNKVVITGMGVIVWSDGIKEFIIYYIIRHRNKKNR
jgi:hypothetical protein